MVNAFTTSPLEAYPLSSECSGSEIQSFARAFSLCCCWAAKMVQYIFTTLISKHQLYVRVLNLQCEHSIVDLGLFSSHMATNLSGQRKHIVIQYSQSHMTMSTTIRH